MPELTPRQREILIMMRDEDEEIVYEGGTAWVGDEQIAPKTVYALLRVAAISLDQFSKVGGCERYSINETGLKLLEAAPDA